MKKLFKRMCCYFLSISRQLYLREGNKKELCVFVKAVKEKCKKLNVENSNFSVPSGSTIFAFQSQTTCRDMMKIMIAASKNEILRNVWKNKEYIIKISGQNERSKKIVTTVQNSQLEKKYKICGGKTGTLALVGNELLICNLAIVTEINNKIVTAVIMNIDSPDNRFFAMERLLDCCQEKLKGKTTDFNIENAAAYIACVEGDDENYDILCEHNADVKYHSASLAKVITVLTATDFFDNINEEIEIKKTDLFRGSGAIFHENDLISFEDAVYAMMMCSSNQAAQAVARTVSEKAVQQKTDCQKDSRADSFANAN